MNKKIYAGLLLLSFFTFACQKAEFGDPVILVSGTEVSPIVKFTVEDTPAEFSVTASSTHKTTEDINVVFEFNEAAVEQYNKEHKTTYFVAPAAALEITNLSTVIKAGTAASSPVSVKVISTSPLLDGRSYLIPLTIKTVTGGNMGVLESSRTILLRIARVINFASVSMNNATSATTGSPGQRGSFNGFALFDPQNPAKLANFTLEIKNLMYGFRTGDGNTNPQPIQYLVCWTDQWENTSIGLRYGELGYPGNSLQVIGKLGGKFAYGFNTDQWYTLSLSYDGSKCILYVDGNPAAELPGSMVMDFSRMQFGQCWGGYHTRQYVNGRIAEVRVWERALTASEIKLNLCGADPNADGLLAYWKMNEGSGSIFRNSSKAGAKYDMDWSKVYWDPSGAGNDNLVQANKSSFVYWANDALNKCSQ